VSANDLVPLNGLSDLLSTDEQRQIALQNFHRQQAAKSAAQRTQEISDSRYPPKHGYQRWLCQMHLPYNRHDSAGNEMTRHSPLAHPDTKIWADSAEMAEIYYLRLHGISLLTPPAHLKTVLADSVDIEAEAEKPRPKGVAVHGVTAFESAAVDADDVRMMQNRQARE
jgi:hypothetical protein